MSAVYVTVQVEFYTDTSLDEMRLLFTAAAECDPTDVLKLTTRSGRLLKLSADLPANKPSNRYRLHVTATPVTGATIASTLGFVHRSFSRDFLAPIECVDRQPSEHIPCLNC